MAYDAYRDIPQDLRPTTSDAIALNEIARLFKEAVRLRHDFHAAMHASDALKSIGDAFTPAILRQGRPAEMHLHGPSGWESAFARTSRPDARTLAGIAGEHMRLTMDAKTAAARIQGNAKLAKLVKENLHALFPAIGYSSGDDTGLRRLRKDDRSVLQIFHPLGVEDTANIIRLLVKRGQAGSYYW